MGNASLVKIGLDCKVYRQSTGSRVAWPAAGSAPNLTLIGNIRNVKGTAAKAMADVATRESGGIKTYKGTLIDVGYEFELIWKNTVAAKANVEALRDAFYSNLTLAMAFLDGASDVDGTTGIWADWEIEKFDELQGNEEVLVYTVSVKPAETAVAPEAVEVVVT